MSEVVKFADSKVVEEVERTEVLDAFLSVPVVALGGMAGAIFGLDVAATSAAAAGVYVAGSTMMNRAFLAEMLRKGGFSSSKSARLPLKAWVACMPIIGRRVKFQHEAIVETPKGKKEIVVDFQSKGITMYEEIIRDPIDSWDILFESETGTSIKSQINVSKEITEAVHGTRASILAARGRVALDKQLGRHTPVHIEDEAKLSLR